MVQMSQGVNINKWLAHHLSLLLGWIKKFV